MAFAQALLTIMALLPEPAQPLILRKSDLTFSFWFASSELFNFASFLASTHDFT